MIPRSLALAFALALSSLAPVTGAGQTAQALFGARGAPTGGAPAPIGGHSRGCLAGAVQLPESGPTWQAMRLSRNHHWGHPETIRFIVDLSEAATKVGWHGLYVGDIGQARGGPVPGHASHQTGLDIDIWFTPAMRLDLSRADRERLGAIDVRTADQRGLTPRWTPAHDRLIATAASDPRVERIFVTPPVKLHLCAQTPGRDRDWLAKVRPWWGHNNHFHVRLRCPAGAAACLDPDPLPPGDGCAEAVWWVTEALEPPDPDAPAPPQRTPLTLADLPAQCAQVLNAR
jgi:penicillin-insensitive murein endopeptidase